MGTIVRFSVASDQRPLQDSAALSMPTSDSRLALASWKFEGTFSVSQTPSNPSPSIRVSGQFNVDSEETASDSTASAFSSVKPPSPQHSHSASNAHANDVGFSFVNVAHPNDARGSQNKRAIRSHVARVQHSKTRASNSAVKDSCRSTAGTRRRSLNIRPKPEPDPENESQSQSQSTEQSRCSSRSEGDFLDRVDSIVPRSRHDSYVQIEASDKEQRRMQHPATIALVRILSGGRQDPFWTYPIPHQPHMERIIDHYLVNIAVDVPFIVPPNEKGLLKRKWFPLSMAEPAAFYTIMLMAASHHAVVNPAWADAFNLLTLRGKAIAAINDALADPQRSSSDSTLSAVMKMASYEAIFGEEKFFHAHMNGLQQMVRLRGGLPELGMDGLLERIVLWIDSNASHHLGCAWKFDKKWFPTTVLHPRPDAANFAGGEDPPTCPTTQLAPKPPPSKSVTRKTRSS